jgi:indolepyruvate decarboxylase
MATPASAPSADSEVAVRDTAIGDYLVRRLLDYGVRDIFGIPGDYILSFYAKLERSPIRVIGCTREDCAGFAADAYARINGIGAACVTYCVGGLSLANSVAGAYAEKSPVVVISGSPGISERFNNPLLHHRVKDFRTQLEVFRRICGACTAISDPQVAFREIDRVLESVVRYRRPGYIELPRDMVGVVPETAYRPVQRDPKSDPAALAEALAEAVRRISASRRPVILAGVEIHRFGLQDRLLLFAERTGIPITATMLGKSVVGETHPLFVGIYEGAMGREEVTRFVEESDCVIILGAFMTDINLGIGTANLDLTKCIYATSETLRISHHHFHDLLLSDFLTGLAYSKLKVPQRTLPPRPAAAQDSYAVRPDEPITIRRLMARLNQSLDDNTVVIADIGDALFASSELVIHRRTEYVSPAYYTSMGFAVPAALGVLAARPEMRAVVIVGDGAFQMTGMELSTIARRGLAPVVIVLDNGGYGTERRLHAGDHEFNDIHPWHYHRLPEVLGGGIGFDIHTEDQFDAALNAAWANRREFSLLHVHLGRDDCSKALERIGAKLSARI